MEGLVKQVKKTDNIIRDQLMQITVSVYNVLSLVLSSRVDDFSFIRLDFELSVSRPPPR